MSDGHVTEPVYSGRSLEGAIAQALDAEGLERNEARIEVLDRGSRGFLGLGSRPARVRVRPEGLLVASVLDLARGLLREMGIEGAVRGRQSGAEVHLRLDAGPSEGALIGKRGETLHALEHLLLRMGSRQVSGLSRVRLDVGGYRQQREETLRNQARELADRVARTGRRAQTPVLSGAERELVVRVLEKDRRVHTQTSGTGDRLRVAVAPRHRRRRRRS